MVATARWIAIAALFLIPFIPLYVASGSFFPFITGKGFLFRILVEVACAAWLILAVARKEYRPRFSWALVMFGLLTAWMFIADMFAVNPHKAFWSNYERMDGWVTLAHLFLFFVVAGSVLSVGNLWRKWWLTLITASAFVVVYGLFQLMGVMKIHQSGVRVDASLGNAAYLAAYLLFLIPLTIWQGIVAKGWLRYSLLTLAALQVLILFNTATRGALIGFTGAVFFASLLALWQMKKTARAVAIGALALVVVSVSGFFVLRESPMVTGNPILSRFASISLEELSTRFTIWGMAYQGFTERPVTGWGQEGFNYVFNAHYQPSLYAQEQWFDRVHNTYLDWLIAGGIPAFLLFLALLACTLFALFRKDVPPVERTILFGALAAYGIQALVVFDNLFSYVPLAALMAYVAARASRPWGVFERLPELPRTHIETAVSPIALVVLIVVMWAVNVPGMSAAGDMIEALKVQNANPEQSLTYFKDALASGSFATQEIREQLAAAASSIISRSNVPNATKETWYRLAVEEMQRELVRAPNDVRLRLEYAALLHSAGDVPGALAEMEIAQALSPNKQSLLIQKGLFQWTSGNSAAARDTLLAAYELDTSFDGAAAYAAGASIAAGDAETGERMLEEHFGTTIVDHQALITAFFETKRYDDLIAIYQLRVQNTGGAPAERFDLARALAALGRVEEARTEVTTAIKEHPASAREGAALLEQFSSAGKGP